VRAVFILQIYIKPELFNPLAQDMDELTCPIDKGTDMDFSRYFCSLIDCYADH